MKKKTIFLLTFLVVYVAATLIMPTKVYASQQLNLKIGSWFHDKDSYTMDYDVNLYYSFYNKDKVVLNIDGNKATMTLKADKFTHKDKNFETPQIDFTGTYKKDGKKNIINLSGKVNGTFINEYIERVNYTKTTIDRMDIEIIYYDDDVKNGKVTAKASGRADGLVISKNSDNPEREQQIDDAPIFTIKEFEITGISENKEPVASTNQKDNKKDNKKENNKDIKEEKTTEDDTEKEEKSSPIIPVVIVTSSVVIIGGVAIARYLTTKNKKTGESKTFEYNPESGEYENGNTILNTSNIEEVNKQAESDRKWIESEREKIKNGDTLQDRENRKMQEELNQKTKEVEREIYIDKVAGHNGITATDEATIREELAKKQEIKVKDQEDRQKILEHMDTTIAVTEGIVEGADTAMAIGEAVVPGGKAVSASYKVLKGVGQVAADSAKNAGDVMEAAITSAADAVNTFTDNKLVKAGRTVASNVAGKVANAAYNDKDLVDAAKDGTISGGASAVVNAAGDELGEALGGKAGSAIGNVASSKYQKHVVDPKLEKK